MSYGLARLWDKRQFVYNLSTNCVHFVLVLSSFCPKFVTTKTTKIFVICQVLDKNKTKVRQMTNCLQIVLVLSCFCTNFDKWQFFCCFVVKNFRQKLDKTKTNCRLSPPQCSVSTRKNIKCLRKGWNFISMYFTLLWRFCVHRCLISSVL